MSDGYAEGITDQTILAALSHAAWNVEPYRGSGRFSASGIVAPGYPMQACIAYHGAMTSEAR